MNSFEKVYEVVAKIPKGKVLTYKRVAGLASVKNARVVGFAMYANKDFIKVPCHRVVGSNGKLTGYARGGITKKGEILKREGVKFLDSNTVDLEKSLYKFPKLSF